MFDGSSFPKSLSESTFDEWLENGRESKIGYSFLLIVWDEMEDDYRPVYLEERVKIAEFERYDSSRSRESLVAAYDLYSESRIV